jgi:hypothetical protein
MADRSDYSSSVGDRTAYLDQSLEDLQSARETFQFLPDGDRSAQVSDTDALMARTHLSAGDLVKAQQRLKMAMIFGSSALRKTAFDCLILTDEIETEELIGSGSSTPPSIGGIERPTRFAPERSLPKLGYDLVGMPGQPMNSKKP